MCARQRLREERPAESGRQGQVQPESETPTRDRHGYRIIPDVGNFPRSPVPQFASSNYDSTFGGFSPMRVFDAAGIRNVALVGHSGAGKTQLASALLFGAGAVNRFGK